MTNTEVAIDLIVYISNKLNINAIPFDVTNDIDIDSIFSREAQVAEKPATEIEEKECHDDGGDLNPDPFHLTIAEARYLASKVDDPIMNKDIADAMWAGEELVPIARHYEQFWMELKNA